MAIDADNKSAPPTDRLDAESPDRVGEAETPKSTYWDGRYRVIRTLGHGGLARVLLGHDSLRDKREVALKILHSEHVEDPDAVSAFVTEFQRHRALAHPHMPRALTLGFCNVGDAAVPYYTMTLCRGTPLPNLLQRGLGLKPTFDLVAGVLRALAHLHQRGLVHCDVKPANILVGEHHATIWPWLIDFGLAAPTGSTQLAGTPEYSAPELLAGEAVDARSDLYAVGLLLYELIERRRPWRGNDSLLLLQARRETPRPPLSAPDCPLALATLIHDLLAPAPERRPRDAREALDRLSAAMGYRADLETPDAFAAALWNRAPVGVEPILEAGERMLAGLASAVARQAADSGGGGGSGDSGGSGDDSGGSGDSGDSGGSGDSGDDSGIGPRSRPREGAGRGSHPVMGVFIPDRVGQDADSLLQPVADRAASLGAYILPLVLERPSPKPLGCLDPILRCVSRLHGLPQPTDPSPTQAAVMIARSPRPTVLVITGAEHLDRQSVVVLRTLLRSSHGRVRLLAAGLLPRDGDGDGDDDGDGDAHERRDDPCAAIAAIAGIVTLKIAPLTPEAASGWLDATLGDGLAEALDVDVLVSEGRDRPASFTQFVESVVTLRRAGRVLPCTAGFRVVASAPTPPPLPTPQDALAPTRLPSAIEEALSILRAPVSEGVLAKLLGVSDPLGEHGQSVDRLLGDGILLRTHSGAVAVANEARRAVTYGHIARTRRRQLHRRLAIALEEAGIAPCRSHHARIADEYLRSDAPLMALTHLVLAATSAPACGRGDEAHSFLDRGQRLLKVAAQHGGSLDLWRYWAMLYHAQARVALQTGELQRCEEIASALLHLGTEHAHKRTLRQALETRLSVHERRRDWDRLVDDAGALITISPRRPPARETGETGGAASRREGEEEGSARCALHWARALQEFGQGSPAEGKAQLERASQTRPSPSLDWQLRVLRTRAAMAVQLQRQDEAERALPEYLSMGTRLGRKEHVTHARCLEATMLRLTGRPDLALLQSQQLLQTLEGVRMLGVDSLIEWELACCHLEFGHAVRAREFAERAESMARDDGDLGLQIRARLVHASALEMLGEGALAWRHLETTRKVSLRHDNVIDVNVNDVVNDVVNDNDASNVSDAANVNVSGRLAVLEMASQVVGPLGLDDIIRVAGAIGWRSRRRQACARSARAFGLAAQAAILRRDGALAVQFATLAGAELKRCAANHIHRPRHLHIEALAAALRGDADTARAHFLEAGERVQACADQMADPDLRLDFLATAPRPMILEDAARARMGGDKAK